jgi:uncharacterized pyridoxamine 5'-phosphate oxidase family protein
MASFALLWTCKKYFYKQEVAFMLEIESILKQNPNGVLATKNGEMLATRVFQFLFADGNKIYFCTSSKKPVFKQLNEDPNVSFCTYSPNYAPVLSVNGKVTFVDDMALKTRALDENPGIKNIYNAPDNEAFKLFYIDAKEIDTFSFTEGPKTIKV